MPSDVSIVLSIGCVSYVQLLPYCLWYNIRSFDHIKGRRLAQKLQCIYVDPISALGVEDSQAAVQVGCFFSVLKHYTCLV